jgi:predicted phosphodiesterase
MPRLAIISDIHGNRVALEEVLRDCEVRNIDAILCLGDIVGYGPEPSECLALVRSNCRLSIRGNHEDAVLNPAHARTWNYAAQAGIAYARRTMTQDALAFLATLPSSFAISETILGIHDSPTPNEEGMTYLKTRNDAIEAFGWFDEHICLVGHTHVPCCFTTRTTSSLEVISPDDVDEHPISFVDRRAEIELPTSGRAIINPGSVGQPRDRDPRASYCVVDLGRSVVEMQRVAYDIAEAQRRTLAAGLPGVLGERLAIGA